MPPPDASAAAGAATLEDAKLPPHGPGGHVDLELFVDDRIFLEVTAAMRTGLGKRGFERFVDGCRGGRRPMDVLAMLRAGFPSWFLGMRSGRPLGERAGLAFDSTTDFVELLLQFGDAFLEFVDLAIAFTASGA